MARFDVYQDRGSAALLLDCQADVLNVLETRFVVPLLPPFGPRPEFPRLNPVFDIGGRQFVMITQGAASVPVASLGGRVASLAERQWDISNAIDLLLTGV